MRTAVYGGGGFAREVAWLVEACGHTVACFVDDDPSRHGTELNGIPVMSLAAANDSFEELSMVGAIGTPKARETVIGKAEAAGMQPATFVHPNTQMSKWVDIGEGTVICAGNILTTNIRLGRHVQINLDCTVGHDVVMADYVTLAPGVHVSGWVRLERSAYVGTGAVIVNGTRDEPIVIGEDAVVGAGACVTRSVDPGTTVVGVPAKPLPG